MAFDHGKKAAFSLDNAAGVLTALTQFLNNVSMTKAGDIDETSVLGTDDKTYIPGLKGATISIAGNFDSAADEILDAAVGAIRSFEYGPQGTTAGKVRYTGECICTSYEPATGTGGKGTSSAQFTVTGAPVRDTFA